jgi:hypothetical protein
MLPLPEKLLVLHAGTHKTATSYIQSRLQANQALLQRCGVQLAYPQTPARKHKPLARALARAHWGSWERFLAQLAAGPAQAIVSAEQFTQPLARPARHRRLVELLTAAGYRLRVVLFLRDQPDYINARYVHSSRRLYHYQDFEAYVQEQLLQRRHIFDYEHLLAPLLSHPLIECQLLPYASGLGDPFERLMASQGWQPLEPWLPADPSKGNVQPGCRGVWLAQAIGERLEQRGVRGRALANTGAVVRRIAERQGWQDDRYCGFDAEAAARVATHYQPGNDRLAERVWGCRWQDRFPPPSQMQRRVFEPPSPGTPERRQLEQLVEQGLQDLARGNPRLRRRLTVAAAAQR